MWQPSDLYSAWEQIHHALVQAMKPLSRQTLRFLASRASGGVIRRLAAEVLDWRENRYWLRSPTSAGLSATPRSAIGGASHRLPPAVLE